MPSHHPPVPEPLLRHPILKWCRVVHREAFQKLATCDSERRLRVISSQREGVCVERQLVPVETDRAAVGAQAFGTQCCEEAADGFVEGVPRSVL
ncbi:MAG: hypothetical protein AMS20_03250 [Gemmatimonas sp. SG8_28]|nr:MAG: hypothetical protein AMS20_03250 [Gemmatimonas sp. SG8_28]